MAEVKKGGNVYGNITHGANQNIKATTNGAGGAKGGTKTTGTDLRK